MKISIQTGSATALDPITEGRRIIVAHITNNVGAWGKGFVLAVNEVSMAPKMAYEAWAKEKQLELGSVQFVEAKPGYFVANMTAQTLGPEPVKVQYDKLKMCLTTVFSRALMLNAVVSMPAGMGSGLAGGDKETILKLIEKTAKEVEDSHNHAIAMLHGWGNPKEIIIKLWEFTDTSAASYIPSR